VGGIVSYWYEPDPDDRRIVMLLVGAVVGALVIGTVWLGQWWFSSREAEPSQNGAVGARQESGSGASGEVPSQLERCRDVYDAQRDPLRTAAASLTQWEVHIGAMNKLVVGAITLEQAWQFWNRTRAGAWTKLGRFDTARRRYEQRVFRCPAPNRPAEATADLVNCHRAVSARSRRVRLATVALETWRQHVHHMDMLRSGEMAPEEAIRLWLQNWRQGDREVKAFRASGQAVGGRTC
jgi:hypothetical protein